MGEAGRRDDVGLGAEVGSGVVVTAGLGVAASPPVDTRTPAPSWASAPRLAGQLVSARCVVLHHGKGLGRSLTGHWLTGGRCGGELGQARQVGQGPRVALHRLGVEHDRLDGLRVVNVQRYRRRGVVRGVGHVGGGSQLRGPRDGRRGIGGRFAGVGARGLVVRGVPGGHEVGGQPGGDLLLLGPVGWGVGLTGLVGQG